MRLIQNSVVLVLGLGMAAPLQADKRLDQALAKAEAQLAKGKEDEAIKLLQKAASQARRDPVAQLALAQLLARLGRWAEAAPAFGEAVERASGATPDVRARVLAARAVFALRAGTSEEALTFARQAVEAEAGAPALGALARAQARRGDPAARATAERAVQAGPASAGAHLARGEALLAACLGAEAEAAYRRALELEPGLAAAGSGLALALAMQGKASQAKEAARAAAQADARSAEAVAALAVGTLAEDPLDKASEAIAAVQQASFLEPDNARVKLMVGRVFESRGQLDKAAAAYGEAVRLDPSWPAPRLAALDVRWRESDTEGSLAAWRALPESAQASGEAQLLLGKMLRRAGESQEAAAALERAVAALPGLAEAHSAHATAAYELGELTLAAKSSGEAVRLEPGTLAYRTSHGLFLAYDGRLEDGRAELLEVTRRAEGRTAEVWMKLGWINRSFEPPRVAQAVAAYQEALKLEPKNGQAALGVAQSYRAGGQWERAVAAYERVSTLDRRLERQALLGAAWCYYRSGDSYKAGFYIGLAARAGADVGVLRAALGTQPWAVDELAELAEQLRSKHSGEQARAVRGLVRLGRPAVPALAAALQRDSSRIAVREQIVLGLGRLGPAAREALPQLDRLIQTGPRRGGGSRDAAREEKLVAAMQAAAEKIRGK